jgi:hypothetical protein
MTRDDRIRIRAYEIWQREGRPDGRHEDHWVEATREIDEEDAAEQQSVEVREADRRQGDEGTTDQHPRWEGPPENRPGGYLPAVDDPARDKDAAGETLSDPVKSDLSDAFKTSGPNRRLER